MAAMYKNLMRTPLSVQSSALFKVKQTRHKKNGWQQCLNVLLFLAVPCIIKLGLCVFNRGLFQELSITDTQHRKTDDCWIPGKDEKGSGCRILWYYPGIHIEGLRKTVQIASGSYGSRYELRNCRILLRSSIDSDVSSKAWCTKYNTLNNSHEKNAKLSLYMTWRHTEVVEVQLQSLLNLALPESD